MTMPPDSTRNIEACIQLALEGLDQQCVLLETLRQLASSQAALIEASEHDSLLEVVRKRQDLVDQLNAARQAMNPAITVLQEAIDDVPQEARTNLRTRISTVQQLIDQVAEIDTQDANRLKLHQSTCRASLERLTATAIARNGYRPTTQPGARFADAKG